MSGRDRTILVAWMLLLPVLGVVSAEAAVEVGARLDRNEAAVGDQLVLTIEVVGETRAVDEPRLPELPDFEVYGGGQSQRFSFVNGVVSANFSFTYYLRPRREGTFPIPPVVVTVDGQEYRTLEIPLTVHPAGTRPAPPATPPSPGASSSPDYFVTLEADKDSCVVGEQILLTFAFHRAARSNLFDSPEYTPPTTEGFWREDLPPERRSTRVIRSRAYEVLEIRYALFPTRQGELEIGPATVKVSEDPFPSFFRSRNRRGPQLLATEPITIHVRALPQPAPRGFEGTVARDLQLSCEVDRETLAAGEALTLRMQMVGEGYMAAASEPRLPEVLDDFRVHDAGRSLESAPGGERLRGTLAVEKLLIPLREGSFTLPPVRYVYFDTGKGEYVTLGTEPIPLVVSPAESATPSVFAGGGKAEIELLARDILHIQPVAGNLRPYAGPLPRRPGFWAMLALPALFWAGSGTLASRRRRLLSDPQRLRATRALARARRRLAGEEPVGERVGEALRSYVADKSSRAAAGLTRPQIEAWLAQRAVDASTAGRLLQLLDRCDALRFAPGTSADDALALEADRVLEELERELRHA